MHKVLFALTTLATICSGTPQKLRDLFPFDFYDAMRDNNKFFDKPFMQQDPTWQFIHTLYNRAMDTPYNLQDTPRIPMVFHLIWLGSSIPQRYHDVKKQLETFHPGCTVKLWTDREAQTYQMINRAAFEKTNNYGEKSDIWRYEILYNEGGVYLDGDHIILQALTPLFYACDFFAGISQWHEFSLSNAFIGTCPHHPIIKHCIDTIIPVSTDLNCESIMYRTGPYFFTRCFMQRMQEDPFINIALPPSFLFPWPHYVTYEDNTERLKSFIKPYSLTVHMHAVSWAWWSKNFGK